MPQSMKQHQPTHTTYSKQKKVSLSISLSLSLPLSEMFTHAGSMRECVSALMESPTNPREVEVCQAKTSRNIALGRMWHLRCQKQPNATLNQAPLYHQESRRPA